MHRLAVGSVAALLSASLFFLTEQRVSSAGQATAATTTSVDIAAVTSLDIRTWDRELDASTRSGALRLEGVSADDMLEGRSHERLQQYHNRVPVHGGGVVRQVEDGQTISIFGVLYEGITLDTAPALTVEAAIARLLELSDAPGMEDRSPTLLVLPLDEGGYALVYHALVAGPQGILDYFIDAHSGEVRLKLNHIQTQAAVGQGRGVLGDVKKVSAAVGNGGFVARDDLRPPFIGTYDLKGNWSRADSILKGRTALGTGDYAFDTDNSWNDPAVVDAHAWAGLTHDYFWKRFNRRGLNGASGPVYLLVHAANRADWRSIPSDYDHFLLGAGYCGGCGVSGIDLLYFGDGLPPGVVLTDTGQRVDYLAGAIDVVAHELAHGVIGHTSGLVYANESGALNEAFSDIIGTSVEFYYQASGSGAAGADYLLGEDVQTPGGVRSMTDPRAFGDRDHYSARYIGSGDFGGVHTNSGIANNAFYLAIEGGTNRTSGRRVTGVGAANREQIERVFYRAFTTMLTSGARFITARSATIQSARDLYGTGSAAERGVTEAWDAVGVFQGATLTTTFTPDPVSATNVRCSTTSTLPNWSFRADVRETGGAGFTVTSAAINFYDDSRRLLSTSALSFPGLFNDCGAGSSRVPAGGRACAQVCVWGLSSGYVDFAYTGRDDNGVSNGFSSSFLRLARLGGTGVPTDTPPVLGPPEFTAVSPPSQ